MNCVCQNILVYRSPQYIIYHDITFCYYYMIQNVFNINIITLNHINMQSNGLKKEYKWKNIHFKYI